MSNFYQKLCDAIGAASVREQEPMSAHTTFRAGGPARYFVTPEGEKELAAVLAALPKGCLIVDLASKPGGTDFAAARRLGHTALHALSLPTVWAPETAGEALARTVQAILQEREGTI